MIAAAVDGGLVSFLPHLGVAGGVIVASMTVVWRRRRDRRTVPRPATVGPGPGPERSAGYAWSAARDRFDALSGAYAAFECDPVRVARRPALADVEVPSTARFVDAYAEALAMRTDEAPPDQLATRFVAAVQRAVAAWAAAVEAAERIALSHVPPRERSVLVRVVKLLTVARESDSEPERRAAYFRARVDLERLDAAGVVRLPGPARAVLDAGARGELTA